MAISYTFSVGARAARVLRMLAPYPWEPGGFADGGPAAISFDGASGSGAKVRVTVSRDYAEVALGQLRAPGGFPREARTLAAMMVESKDYEYRVDVNHGEIRRVATDGLPANADAIVERENAAGRHLPVGFVDAGYICDACTADAAAEQETP